MEAKRYETKFRITYLNYHEIESLVKTHPAIFREIHNKRNINNIYFDTNDLSNYLDNVEGETRRQKVRIRWYGDLFGGNNKPKLEIKNKRGLLGWKERYEIKNFSLNKKTSFNYKEIFDQLIESNDLNILRLNLKSLRPTLLNRYERTYYLSHDKKFRITLDRKMNFYSINPFVEHFKTFTDTENTIVELKYDESYIDQAKKITQFFPHRVTKNSKYVVGIDKIANWK
jgi:SPX domain protein involved in polyphosphate accumulation